MTIKDFQRNLMDAAREIRQESPRIVRRSGMDALSIVRKRIQEEGVSGARYKSKSKVPYFQGGKGKGAKKDYGTHGKVDLTLSNRMWNGTQVLGAVEVRPGLYQAQIGGTDQEVDDKLIANMNRYGNFLEPNEQEQQELLEDSGADVMDIIKKHIG